MIGGDETKQPQLHILSERRLDDPVVSSKQSVQSVQYSLSDGPGLEPGLVFLQQEEMERLGGVGAVPQHDSEEGVAGGVGYGEEEEAEDEMRFSELLSSSGSSDPASKEDCPDPPSSTTGPDTGEKPGKRTNQGKLLFVRLEGTGEAF